MKLYTEEEVKRAMLHSYLSGVERPSDYLPIEESILDELTPIELPSNEEIDNKAFHLPFDGGLDKFYNEGLNEGFYLGIEFIKEQILNQNK